MNRVVKILMEREGFSRAEAEGALILNAPVKMVYYRARMRWFQTMRRVLI